MDLAAAIRFPLNKLFGDSATGFGGGQDALENYNAQVTTFRDEIEPICLGAGELRCQQLFGFVPEDLELVWNPLREMSGLEQEQVINLRSERTLAWFNANLLTGQEASRQARKDNVITEDTEVLEGKREAMPSMMMEDERSRLELEGQSAAGEGPGTKGDATSQTGRERANARHRRRHGR